MSGAYRPIFNKRALYEAIGFWLAGVLSIIISSVYSNQAFGNKEVILLLVCIILSCAYYYLRLPNLEITRRRIIEDLLLATGVALGKTYRLNVMRPTTHTDDARRHFKFVCHFRMANTHRYGDLIKLSTHGVGQAYNEKRLVYLPPTDMDRSVDDYPNHVWSINVQSQSGPGCVLNIDTSDNSLTSDQVNHVNSVIQDLAKVMAKYNPGKIAFE